MTLAKLLFVGLVCLALGIIAFNSAAYLKVYSPNVIQFDPGFDRQLQLPTKEINDALDRGMAVVRDTLERASKFGFWSSVATWLAFASSAGVTFVMGWFGRVGGGADAGSGSQGIPKRAAQIVALLAAAASVSTAGGALAGNEASTLRLLGSERHKMLIEARPALAAAQTADEAKNILRDLEISLAR